VRVSGNSPLQYSSIVRERLLPDVMSRGTVSKNPYGSKIRGQEPGRCVVRRQAGSFWVSVEEARRSVADELGWFRLAGLDHCGRGGPIGVVKLLRARGGCLGVIRIRARKAAISPGELPNERRARNTRATQERLNVNFVKIMRSISTPTRSHQ
jgi:hypothetical protein